MKWCIILAVFWMLACAGVVTAENEPQPGDESSIQTPAGAGAETPVPSPQQTHKAEELSTKLKSADSLGVMPDVMEEQQNGGTRRVHLESSVFRREKPVDYSPEGRRDPFRALIVDEKKEGDIETDLFRLDGATLTGVVWSDGHYLALAKDKDGRNFFLREGDPIYQGHVTMVTQSQATFEVSDFGDYEKVVLKVKVKDTSSKGKG